MSDENKINIDSIADGTVDINHYLKVQSIAISTILNEEMLRRRVSNFLLDLKVCGVNYSDYDSYKKLCKLLDEMNEDKTYKRLDIVLDE